MSNPRESHPRSADDLKGPPSGYLVVVPPGGEADAITLGEVLSIAFASWKLILVCAVVAAVLAGAASFLIRPTYRATVVVSPVVQAGMGGAGALRNQLGGLAALAGIDLGSGGRDKEQSLATLKSSGFARDFIVAENLLPLMYPERWDPVAKQWRAGEKPPSLELAVTQFTRHIRTISEEQRTGIVTLTVEWFSPELAAQWANRMMASVNDRMRLEATRNSERSISFLNQELEKTPVVELQHAIYRLIEEQVNNAMLANVQREYAFRVIDPAFAPEQRSSPQRTMMVLVGGVIGGFIGLCIVFIRRSVRAAGLHKPETDPPNGP